MIKELVLSIILSAYSAAPFLDSPKKTIDRDYEAAGNYQITLSPGSWRADATTPFGDIETIAQEQDPGEYRFDAEDGQDANIRIAGLITGEWASVDLFWYFLSEEEANAFYRRYVLALSDGLISIDTNTGYVEAASEPRNTNEGWETSVTFTCDEYDERDYFYVSFSLVDYRVPVTPNFSFVNCNLEGLPPVYVGNDLEVTLVASTDYGIPNTTQVITGGAGYSAVEKISESNPVTQTGLFEKVTFRFVNVQSNLSATFHAVDISLWSIGYQWGYDDGATYPTDTAYQKGKEDGEKIGYRTGYEDGKKDYQAGGIWSWFESAANVLASFLDIRLFPSFTIGNLVGAIVGLTIILFFVRAFLFKS